MDDRQLLEAAARAAGYDNATYQDMSGWGEVRYGLSFAMWVPELDSYWNPLTDDGDALKLAVMLRMAVSIHEGHCVACAQLGEMCTETGSDTAAVTRRAIVRAAAAIGATHAK